LKRVSTAEPRNSRASIAEDMEWLEVEELATNFDELGVR
jgi:hypothetical protein